ncbi:hypothetical protein AB4585_24660, partial [Vibrio sp. 10N.222.49.C9]
MENEQVVTEPIVEHLGHFLIDLLSLFSITFDRSSFIADIALFVVTLLVAAFTYLVVRHFMRRFIHTSSQHYNAKTKLTIKRKHLPEKVSVLFPYYLFMSTSELIVPKTTIPGQLIDGVMEIGAAILVLR